MSKENVEVIKGIFAGWARGDFTSTDWADPEIEFTIPGPDRHVHRGVEAMGRAWAEWLGAWKDFRVEATAYRDLGNKVVVSQEFRGKGRGSGIPVDLPGAAVFTLRNGKVVRFAGHVTLEEALADAGGD